MRVALGSGSRRREVWTRRREVLDASAGSLDASAGMFGRVGDEFGRVDENTVAELVHMRKWYRCRSLTYTKTG